MYTARHPSSFRDPSGFIFEKEGVLYRQVNQVYKDDYALLHASGLYEKLVHHKKLIPHQEVNENITGEPFWLTTLLPEKIPFISYPSEWSFDMLKDAALLTLEIASDAMHHNMMLKDASAYNIQFYKGKMIFIDTLSYEKYDPSKPWIAYRQFCEHFLAPLALMHYNKLPLQDLWKAYPDGFPLHIASRLLPFASRFHLHTYLNIHLHAKISAGNSKTKKPAQPFSLQKLTNLLRSLKEAIQSYTLEQPSGVWSGYYDEASQRDQYMERKKEIIQDWLKNVSAETAIDAGANEGFFSNLLAEKNIFTIAADLDHFSVNNLYTRIKKEKLETLHPLIINLGEPTPSLGLNNEERSSFFSRMHTDLVLALAVIHHLSIRHNIPFNSTASMFCKMGKDLIIEFVPRTDEKISIMLEEKKDVYDWYTVNNFEQAYSEYFSIKEKKEISGSGRILYLMQSHDR